jgi:hypothetical protein
MSELPTGTVTFMFTDIEGSTRLLQRLGGDYQWLSRSGEMLSAQIELAFMYVEMNGFDINNDRWFCDAMGYTREIDLQDLDDLADVEAELHWAGVPNLDGDGADAGCLPVVAGGTRRSSVRRAKGVGRASDSVPIPGSDKGWISGRTDIPDRSCGGCGARLGHHRSL